MVGLGFGLDLGVKKDFAVQSFTISAADVRFLSTLAANAGLDVKTVLERLNLRHDLLSNPKADTLSLANYADILQAIALAAGDETCAASSRHLMTGTTQYLLAGLQCPVPLLEVLKALAQGYNFAHGGPFNEVRLAQKSLSYVINDDGFPYADNQTDQDRYTLIESILVSLHLLFCKLTGEALDKDLLRIHTRRPPGAATPSFLRYWAAPIRYDAGQFAIQYTARVADLVVDHIDSSSALTIFDVARQPRQVDALDALSEGHWGARVRAAIDGGASDQSEIARLLGVSVATLRRRLEGEGTSFRVVKADALNERARQLIRSRSNLEDVAEILGFSDLRSFSRAYKSWNGITPKGDRKRALERA